ASDGRQGIQALRGAPDTDLILMDLMMPGMDGYATMAAIRQMPQFRELPIIAVTARAMPGDREKSLAAGANDYVTKPVDTDELLTCMERWLPAAAPLSAAPPAAAGPPEPAASGGSRKYHAFSTPLTCATTDAGNSR